MTQTVQAIYSGGVLKPLEPLRLDENSRVTVIVQAGGAAGGVLACAGLLSNEDAAQMRAAVEEEFEKVDPNEWR